MAKLFAPPACWPALREGVTAIAMAISTFALTACLSLKQAPVVPVADVSLGDGTTPATSPTLLPRTRPSNTPFAGAVTGIIDGYATGWVCLPADPTAQLAVRLYLEIPAATTADNPSELEVAEGVASLTPATSDLTQTVLKSCASVSTHAFSLPVPPDLNGTLTAGFSAVVRASVDDGRLYDVGSDKVQTTDELTFLPNHGYSLGWHEVGALTPTGWSAPAGVTWGSILTYGPYIGGIEAGWSVATVYLKVDDATSDNSVVATLDITRNLGSTVLAVRSISRKMFPAAGVEVPFTLAFENASATDLEFRVHTTGVATLEHTRTTVRTHNYRKVYSAADPRIGTPQTFAGSAKKFAIWNQSLFSTTDHASIPSPTWLHDHWSIANQLLPFNGTRINVPKKHPFTVPAEWQKFENNLGFGLMQPQPLDYDDYQGEIDAIRTLSSGVRLTENFFPIALGSPNQYMSYNADGSYAVDGTAHAATTFDWFDDRQWRVILKNFGMYAKIAKSMAHVRGFIIDTTFLGVDPTTDLDPFNYTSLLAHGGSGHTLLQYQQKIRQRGQEIITALRAEYPDAEMLLTQGGSEVLAAFFGSGNYMNNGGPKGLLPHFNDGLAIGSIGYQGFSGITDLNPSDGFVNNLAPAQISTNGPNAINETGAFAAYRAQTSNMDADGWSSIRVGSTVFVNAFTTYDLDPFSAAGCGCTGWAATDVNGTGMVEDLKDTLIKKLQATDKYVILQGLDTLNPFVAVDAQMTGPPLDAATTRSAIEAAIRVFTGFF